MAGTFHSHSSIANTTDVETPDRPQRFGEYNPPTIGRPADRLSEAELHAIYDHQYVDQYDPHAVQRIQRLLPLFALSGHEVVVDFGCGNGVLLELISPYVREYVGLDFSEAFVRTAERRRDARGIRNGTFHCVDIAAFCADHPNQFDAGFALDFSEHVYDDQFLHIFRAIHGALKPGASLYLHTPNAEYFMERLKERGLLRQVEGHVGVRDARTHQALLAQCGFSNVDVRYLAHYLSLASTLHGLGALPLVGRSFRARLFLTCRK
jgi:2-polyprenyl-6-hydroxyphenyl methylase/3-demethylubiquinone-9 3-methyltransferase